MTYFEHDFVADAAGGYSFINQKQVYDQIAADLTAVGNWSLEDTVDFVSGANTYRKFVWKCAAPGNGIAADFYVIFECIFVTATGVWFSGNGYQGPWVSLCEAYDSATKVASKFACAQTSTLVTLGADRTHPATWTLSTQLRPTSNPNAVYFNSPFPNASAGASMRMCATVTPALFACFTGVASNVGDFYVGVFDSIMDSTDDPMPLFLGASSNSMHNNGTSANVQYGASTRAPKLTPGVSYPTILGYSYGTYHSSSGASFAAGPYAQASSTPNAGAAGDVAGTQHGMFLGGVIASRVAISTSGTGQSGSTRGGMRGFLRNIVVAVCVTNNIGDVFTIDGKPHAARGANSTGSTALIDKTV